MNISELVKQPHFIILGLFILGSLIMQVFIFKRNRNRRNAYLEKHPDSVKVHLKSTHYGVASSAVSIISIDDEEPCLFNGGFYVKPGKSEIVVSFDSKRVGVMYKSVSKSTGYVPIEVDLEKGKEYELSFDKKEGEFVIKEI